MNVRGRTAQCGLTLIELIVVIVVISLVSAVLLNRLAYYQEFAEKVAMEQTVQAMRSGLQMKIASLLLRGEHAEIPRLSNRNPVEFLEQAPQLYAGELADPEEQKGLRGRGWFFDPRRREIVYLVDKDNYFYPGPDGANWARFRVVVEFSSLGGALGGGLGAVSIEATNGFIWDMR